MRLRHPHLTPLALLAALAAGPAAALADLAKASPFLPSSMAGSAGSSGPSGPVELRGVMSTSQGTEYCIYDVVKKTSAWVGLNEEGNGFVVKSADPASDSVTVEFQGRTMNLVLHTAKITSAGPAVPVANNQAGSAIMQTVVLNPTPADEQRRLDAVAAEVRRRRLEREKAAQEAQSGAPAAAPAR